MPWAYERDPITGDRIPDGNGGWKKTRTAANLVRNQMLAHEGECWQDPNLGSRLHRRELFQRDPAPLVADELRRTLRRVEEAGRIANVQVTTTAPRAGRVDGATSFVDQSTGQTVDVKIPRGG